MAEVEDVNFAAIGNAARREEQTVTEELVVTAVKEDDDLFRVEIRKTLLRIIKTTLNVALGLFCVTLVVRAWHLLAPTCWGWIDAEHLKDIDSLLKSGLFVAIGGIGKEVITKSLESKKGH